MPSHVGISLIARALLGVAALSSVAGADPAPSTPAAPASLMMDVDTEKASTTNVRTTPNVVVTPSGPAPLPIPYPVIGTKAASSGKAPRSTASAPRK